MKNSSLNSKAQGRVWNPRCHPD